MPALMKMVMDKRPTNALSSNTHTIRVPALKTTSLNSPMIYRIINTKTGCGGCGK